MKCRIRHLKLLGVFNKAVMINIESIIVVIEPDQTNQPALQRGIDLALKTNAKLMVMLSVYHAGYDLTSMLSSAEREEFRAEYISDRYSWMEEILQAYDLPEGTLTAVHWHNKVYESVVKTAQEENADIIIKSTKHDPVVTSPVFTPLDWNLIRKSPIPVLMVSTHAPVAYNNIVTAVNTGDENRVHSHLNEKLTDCAGDFARLFDSDLHLVNAYPPSPVPISLSSPSFSYSNLDRAIKNHHNQALDMFGERHRIRVANRYVKEGLPEDVIAKIIKKTDAQLLVIGSVGRIGQSSETIGNTAEFVLNKIKCDVLTIKPDGFIPPLH